LQPLPSDYSERLFPTRKGSGLPTYERILVANNKLRQLLLPPQPVALRVSIKLLLSETVRIAAHGRKFQNLESVKPSLTSE